MFMPEKNLIANYNKKIEEGYVARYFHYYSWLEFSCEL
jgi:hypothetical protein